MPDLPFWETFPNFAAKAISVEIGRNIPWHTHAASPQSSQTFCVSAFGPLIEHVGKDAICRQLSEHYFPDWTNGEGSWKIQLEFSDRLLLNEIMGMPSQIDVLLVGPDSVITVESKLTVDALNGLGCCSKANDNSCRGYYGPESNAESPTTWCVLERWNGGRSPRLYWTLGRSYFKSVVFSQQAFGSECPFKGPHYQLMRNFLTAAAYAQKKKKKQFGSLVICPHASSRTLVEQVRDFRSDILLPHFADCVSLAYYDDYISLLLNSNDLRLGEIAEFLQDRMDNQAE
ncbi:MAG: hypothetical protein AABP62_10475 [Planctomycetota bacterium]